MVFAFPPRLSFSSQVRTESRYGMKTLRRAFSRSDMSAVDNSLNETFRHTLTNNTPVLTFSESQEIMMDNTGELYKSHIMCQDIFFILEYDRSLR